MVDTLKARFLELQKISISLLKVVKAKKFYNIIYARIL